MIVGALDSGSSGLGSSPGRGLCVVFLSRYHLAVACGIVTGDNFSSFFILNNFSHLRYNEIHAGQVRKETKLPHIDFIKNWVIV